MGLHFQVVNIVLCGLCPSASVQPSAVPFALRSLYMVCLTACRPNRHRIMQKFA